MKINPIMPSLVRENLNCKHEKAASINNRTSNNALPNTYSKEYYLNFMGGKSLELEQTLIQLQKNKDNFPPDIERLALEIIKDGNPDNDKLIDVHRRKYAQLNECNTLEELKFFFPEFENVKSIDEDDISYNKGFFIDKFKKGQIRTQDGELLLNPKKDLTLQLIQMYWGDCLSLPDIYKACGHNVGPTMHKLDIPLVKPVYGQYLKLSDEESNRAITEAAKRNRSFNERIIRRKGAPLTAEHKKKISDSLKEYYKTHSNIAFFPTEEDEDYFSRNPYQGEIFSQVLKRAWNYREADSLKKALGRFMKKHSDKEINEDVLKNPQQAMALKEFWARNQWAKEKWSNCMTKSWSRQKALDSIGLIYEPKKVYRVMNKSFYDNFTTTLASIYSDFNSNEGSVVKSIISLVLHVTNLGVENTKDILSQIFPDPNTFGMENVKDMLSLVILDEREQQDKPYDISGLKRCIEINGDYIIENHYDEAIYKMPMMIFNVFESAIEKSRKVPYLSDKNISALSEVRKIKRSIDKDFLDRYSRNKNKDDLLKVVDIYAQTAMMCLESTSEEVRKLFEDFNQILTSSEEYDNKAKEKVNRALDRIFSACTR